MENKNNNMQDRRLKSFIRVGTSFIDIKHTVAFSFYRIPDAYVGIQFIYDTGKALNAPLRNRKDFSLFLLECENFIDDPNALSSMKSFMDEIENMPVYSDDDDESENNTDDLSDGLYNDIQNLLDDDI